MCFERKVFKSEHHHNQFNKRFILHIIMSYHDKIFAIKNSDARFVLVKVAQSSLKPGSSQIELIDENYKHVLKRDTLSSISIDHSAYTHFVDIRKIRDGKIREEYRKACEEYRRAIDYDHKDQPEKVEQCFRCEGIIFLCRKCEYNVDLFNLMRPELGLKKVKEFSGSASFFFVTNTQHGNSNSEHSDKSGKTTAFESSALGNETCELANKEAKKR